MTSSQVSKTFTSIIPHRIELKPWAKYIDRIHRESIEDSDDMHMLLHIVSLYPFSLSDNQSVGNSTLSNGQGRQLASNMRTSNWRGITISRVSKRKIKRLQCTHHKWRQVDPSAIEPYHGVLYFHSNVILSMSCK